MSLESQDVAAFEVAARDSVRAFVEGGSSPEDFDRIFTQLASSDLSDYEKSRRAGRVVSHLPMSSRGRLLDVAADAPPAIRSAILARLPEELRSLAYRSAAEEKPEEEAGETQPSEGEEEESGIADLTTGEPEHLSFEAGDDWRTVLLLGGSKEAEINAQLLRSRGMTPLQISSLDHFNDLSREKFCGIVIYSGWWGKLGIDERLSFLQRQIEGSNLLYFRLDLRDLDEASVRVAEYLTELDVEVRVHVSASNGSDLSETDLLGFADTAAKLESASRLGVGVEGIDRSDRQLLGLAIAQFARRKNLTRFQEIEHLGIRPILDGLSGASVLSVRSDAFRAVLIAKIDGLEALSTELARARSTMPPEWTIAGEMCLYSLAGRGVLLQRLILDLDDPSSGAPSFRKRLRACADSERVCSPSVGNEADDLVNGVDRIIDKVRTLNREAAGEVPTRGWMDAEPLSSLSSLGVNWQIAGHDDSDIDVLAQLETAKDVLSEGPTNRRVVHGDLHAENLLMTDNRTPDLIDFALAGSGHPCFDFVRISSAVTYEFLRELVPYADLAAFFVRVHVDGAAEEELVEEFPSLLGGHLAKVVLHTLVECRKASISALDSYNENSEQQYLAMVCLVALQSLTIGTLQQGVVRASLAAVSPSVSE